LALIKLDFLPPGAKVVPLAKKSVSPGQRVHSIGNPGKSEGMWVYTSGTVRQVVRMKWTVRTEEDKLTLEAKVVQTQSPTNPGDSGGPLLNDNAELVGVTQGG